MQWAKYKSEEFHKNFITSLDIRERVRISANVNQRSNFIFTWRLDGTHIPINVRTRQTGTNKRLYISHKPNTKNKKCLAFMVATLTNNFGAGVLWPDPASTHDAKLVHTTKDPSGKKNSQVLNELFQREDTCAADCAFSVFSRTGGQPNLLTSAVISKTKECTTFCHCNCHQPTNQSSKKWH